MKFYFTIYNFSVSITTNSITKEVLSFIFLCLKSLKKILVGFYNAIRKI